MMPLQQNEADASRMDEDMLVRNIADDDEKSIWIGKRRPGICGAGVDERNRTPRKLK